MTGVLKWLISIIGFFRRNNYFVHVLIRLQVQSEAYACIMHSAVTHQHIFLYAISKSCMNVVTVVCQVRTNMHAHVHAYMYALGVQRVKLSVTIWRH